MNHIYRLVWNRALRQSQVASELAHSAQGGQTGGKMAACRLRRLAQACAVALCLSPLLAWGAAPAAIHASVAPLQVATGTTRPAPLRVTPNPGSTVSPTTTTPATINPSGGQVTAGSGAISQSGLTTTIDQHSQNLSLNWLTFNIGADSTVNFVQPNAQAIAVNRIADPNGSVILGKLNANGQVFLINPNGVLFGQGAQINVGGLVASTLDVSDSELGSGTLHWRGDSQARVINQGTIHADGGYAALVAAQVINNGTLAANGGSVALGGGNAVTLSFDGSRLLGMRVDKSTLAALAENKQLIVADGGQVLMSAGAKDALLASTVNNTGTIQARTVENRAGKIVLLGGMQAGTTHVAGTLDASAPNGGDGGFVETSAAHVKVADGAHITTLASDGHTGTWLIDPVDFTIAASGGDMTGAALGSGLAAADVVIQSTSGASGTAGNINVNDQVSWNAHQLTLNAHGDININAALNGSGSAKLALEYGQGAAASGNTAAYHVKAPVNLAAGDNFSTKLGNDGVVVNYKVLTSLGVEGSTTGTDLQGIGGNLTGNYVLGANIDASASSGWNSGAGFDPIGGSGTTFSGSFDGLGHTISGLTINRPSENEIGLFALTNSADLRNVGLLGSKIVGGTYVGALVGDSQTGKITNAWSSGSVGGKSWVGGMVGLNNGGDVVQAHSSAEVTGTSQLIGGLIGQARFYGSVSDSYATGKVNGGGATDVGGLIGQVRAVALSNSYATGAVTGGSRVGGLVGFLDGFNGGKITASYASGAVNGGILVGGLVGANSGTVASSYWNTETTGQMTSAGVGIGLTTAQMFDATGFAGFDFATIWGNGDNQTTPYLLGLAGNQVFNSNDLPSGAITTSNRPNLYTAILDVNQLQAVNADLAGRYLLGNAIDASATVSWNGGDGFAPLTRYEIVPDNGPMCPPECTKTLTFPFAGIFDGLGHAIFNLTINRPTENNLALFGVIQSGAVVQNLGLIGGSISGMYQIGGLAGENRGTISHSYATANINGRSSVGGLVGSNGGTISGSYATGNINDIAYVDVGVISSIGGLVGFNNAIIDSSYSTGNVNGTNYMGGLVGSNEPGGMIGNSYATGNVVGDYNYRGNYYNGGLVGFNTAQISTSYASGGVIDNGANGGLVGYSAGGGTVTNSYWNSSANTKGFGTNNNGASATSLTAGQMMDPTSFAAWGVDISAVGGSTAVWRIYAGHTAPLLRAFMTDLAVTATDVSATYNGAAFVGSSDFTFGPLVPSYWLPSISVDTSLVLGSTSAPVSAVNAGSYALGGDVYSSQMGYDLAFTGGTLTIIPAPLTITSSDVSKTYDGGLGAAGSAVVSLGTLFGSDTLSGGSFAFTDKNAGTGKTVTVTGITVNDGHGGNNYAVTYVDNTASTITPLAITVDATSASKVYDGTNFGIVTLTGNGVLAGDAVSFTGNGLFADKNVGTNKAVTITDITASGADAGNYSFTALPTTTADITPLDITVDATADDKVYDATTDATIALNTSGILAGDMVSFTGTGHFEDKNTGTGKTVTIDGITASGADAGNYRFTAQPATTADIMPLAITVDATADDKVYDATTDATIALGSAGILAGDSVAFTGTGSFDDRHAGVGKTVTVDDIAASGVDAGNYAYNTTATDTADITPATLTYLADPASAWRGQMPAVLGGTVTGLLGDDTLASATEGTLTWTTSAATSSPAGTYAVNGGGLSAQDYVFVQAPGNAAALRVANGSAPQGVVSVVAGLQQSEDSKAPRAPYAPDVRIINGGVRLP